MIRPEGQFARGDYARLNAVLDRIRVVPADPAGTPLRPAIDDPLLDRWRAVRARTEALAASLSEADAGAQSMPDASPAKWHLAHTTWFIEALVLTQHVRGYSVFDPRFDRLFNSYYETLGPRVPRAERGLMTRPSLADVLEWRARVEAAVLGAWDALPSAARGLFDIAIAHEEQHQELLLTDILHLFSRNPLAPAYAPAAAPTGSVDNALPGWIDHPGGIVRIGHEGSGFAFDCEGPSHEALLRPYALEDRLVTNGEWDLFIEEGGYRDPLLWLSDGWDWVKREGIVAPLHWREDGQEFTLAGLRARDPAAPVTHISFYEADAFASWAGARLPTEFEWEAAADGLDPAGGNQCDGAGLVTPRAVQSNGDYQMYGDCWEWTQSAYLPYPGFRAAEGAIAEYNGKFMSGQMVLRGGSCATPRGHLRASYRNFFPPSARWQFTGVRLARDLA